MGPAAVLYVLVSGLIHGPGNTPIGSALGVGGPTLFHPTNAQAGCTAGNYCYEIPVSSASTGVTIGSLTLQVKTASGSIFASTIGWGSADFLSIAGSTLVTSAVPGTTPFDVTSWTASGGTSATALTSSDTLWLDLCWTPNPAGLGLSLVIYGAGSYSGSESVMLP